MKVDYDKALRKMGFYCAYQERCIQEVLKKMQAFDLNERDENKILRALKKEGFLNEKRFAESYARGKFINNYWGKIKISIELRKRNIDELYIDRAISMLNKKDYLATVTRLVQIKRKTNPKHSSIQIVKYLCGKGYEMDLAWKVVKNEKLS